MPYELRGKGVISGIAIAKVMTLGEDLQSYIDSYKAGTSEEEVAKIKEALAYAAEVLQTNIKTLREKGMLEQAGIMEAHRMMVQDPMLEENAMVKLGTCGNAPQAVLDASEENASIFEQMDDTYFRERAVDIRDVGKRVARRILGLAEKTVDGSPVILCGDEIEPSVIANIPTEKIAGVILGNGSTTCHAVIIAKARAIPTVAGLGEKVHEIKDGAKAILNGDTGEIFIDPTEELIAQYQIKLEEQNRLKEHYAQLSKLPAVTKDGVEVDLMANISTHLDVEAAMKFGAKGVGLFRSEFLFMGRDTIPDEESQFKAYKEAIEKCKGHLCVIRTMDIGGDKPLPYLQVPDEENPFLGYRAIRICLNRLDVFMPQVKAILRAGVYGKAAMMLPMVINLDEIKKVREIIEQAKAELAQEEKVFSDNVQLGIMVETPAAAVMTPVFAKYLDFFSIGTNDLVQYTLAVDRVNNNISYLYNHFNPAVLRLIKLTIESARKNNIWVGMCGEMASDPNAAAILMAMGINELSMSAPSIPRVKEKLRSITSAQAKAALDTVMTMEDGEQIKEYLKTAL